MIEFPELMQLESDINKITGFMIIYRTMNAKVIISDKGNIDYLFSSDKAEKTYNESKELLIYMQEIRYRHIKEAIEYDSRTRAFQAEEVHRGPGAARGQGQMGAGPGGEGGQILRAEVS